MRIVRGAFTLIELMIAISILSIMMIFLYKSYASLNKSNKTYKDESEKIKKQQVRKKVIFLDFSLALSNSTQIINQEKNEDVVFLQSTNSLHKNYNPYIAYIMKNENLYRLESLKKFEEYPLSIESEFIIDKLGEINSFRIYKSSKKVNQLISEVYLLDIDFKKEHDILVKIKVLNEK